MGSAPCLTPRSVWHPIPRLTPGAFIGTESGHPSPERERLCQRHDRRNAMRGIRSPCPIQARSVSDGIGTTIGAAPCVASDPPAYAGGLYGDLPRRYHGRLRRHRADGDSARLGRKPRRTLPHSRVRPCKNSPPPRTETVAPEGNPRIGLNRHFKTRQSDTATVTKIGKHLDAAGGRRQPRSQCDQEQDRQAELPASPSAKLQIHSLHPGCRSGRPGRNVP